MKCALEMGGADMQEGGQTKVWAVVLAWGWNSCLWGRDGLGSTGSPYKVLAAPMPAGWLEARHRRCSTAVSSRHEGQVRAAAGAGMERRGWRGGWDRDVEGTSFQSWL